MIILLSVVQIKSTTPKMAITVKDYSRSFKSKSNLSSLVLLWVEKMNYVDLSLSVDLNYGDLENYFKNFYLNIYRLMKMKPFHVYGISEQHNYKKNCQ